MISEITEQVRACAKDGMRVVIEPDDAKELLAFLDNAQAPPTEEPPAVDEVAEPATDGQPEVKETRGAATKGKK